MTPPPDDAVAALLAELQESPLPGARYAYTVVKRHAAGWTLARHVRETGCEGLREAVRRLIDAIETTGLHEHDDGRGGVDLCIPISGIRGVMNDACEAAGHEFLHPEDVPPFCRWCGAALAARLGHG